MGSLLGWKMKLSDLQKILRLIKKEMGDMDANLCLDPQGGNYPLNRVKVDCTLEGSLKLILTNENPT